MLPYRILSLFIFFIFLSFPLHHAYAREASQVKAGKGNFIIDSDSMEVKRAGESIYFFGHVVTREDFTLCSDELEVTFDDNRKIVAIVAIGNVRLLQNDKVATANKAEYDKEAKVIIFSGSPEITSCGDIVSGDKIRYDMVSGSAKVEGGKGVRVRAQMVGEKNCTEDIIIEKDFCRGAR